ncbi:MAG: secondary thiamine-phosphate synthase enzyme YjbQ [Candidatus Aenigmatarchaeota archaeon]
MLFREILKFDTEKNEVKDITLDVKNIIKRSRIKEGICNVFFTGTTGGLIINEDERMIFEDAKKIFERLIPSNTLYMHTSNSFSHTRAMLMDCEKTIPVSNNALILGKWQAILFAEMDVNGRNREIIVTISGD